MKLLTLQIFLQDKNTTLKVDLFGFETNNYLHLTIKDAAERQLALEDGFRASVSFTNMVIIAMTEVRGVVLIAE